MAKSTYDPSDSYMCVEPERGTYRPGEGWIFSGGAGCFCAASQPPLGVDLQSPMAYNDVYSKCTQDSTRTESENMSIVKIVACTDGAVVSSDTRGTYREIEQNGNIVDIRLIDDEEKLFVLDGKYVVALTGKNRFGQHRQTLRQLLQGIHFSSRMEIADHLFFAISGIDRTSGCFISITECVQVGSHIETRVTALFRDEGVEQFRIENRLVPCGGYFAHGVEWAVNLFSLMPANPLDTKAEVQRVRLQVQKQIEMAALFKVSQQTIGGNVDICVVKPGQVQLRRG